MLNILNDVANYIEAQKPDVLPIFFNAFVGENDAIVIRQGASPYADQRYLDGQRYGTINMLVYSRSMDMQTAESQLQDVCELLDLKVHIEISEGVYVSMVVVQAPLYISQSENGMHVFSATVKLDFIGE